MNTVKEVQERLARTISGARPLMALYYLVQYIRRFGAPVLDKAPAHVALLMESIMVELKTTWNRAIQVVKEQQNTIVYAYHDLVDIWPNVTFRDHGVDLEMTDTHDMNPVALSAYVWSMRERLQQFGPCELSAVSHLMTGTVIDFGCGAGHWMKLLVAEGADLVMGVDRADVLSITGWPGNTITIDCLKTLAHNRRLPDVETVWLSQVLHGKKAPDTFLVGLHHLVRAKHYIVVEINPDSPLNRMFDLQLMVHTGNKRVWVGDLAAELVDTFQFKQAIELDGGHYTATVLEANPIE